MNALLRWWDVFLFEPRTTKVLGVYRIVIGLLTIYCFASQFKDAEVFFSDQGLLTASSLMESKRLSYNLFRWVRSPFGAQCALAALLVSAFLFTIGFCTRASSVALFLLVAAFHQRNPLITNSGDTLLRVLLFLFMFAPADGSFSVDRLLDRKIPAVAAPWAQRMMQIQVAMVYLAAFYAKARGAAYHDGSAMYYVFGLVDYHVRGVEQLMNYPLIYSALTFATLYAELCIPLLLWFRSTRSYAAMIGALLHSWIIAFMILPVFGILMIATYIPFFEEDELERLGARLRAALPGQRRSGGSSFWMRSK